MPYVLKGPTSGPNTKAAESAIAEAASDSVALLATDIAATDRISAAGVGVIAAGICKYATNAGAKYNRTKLRRT